MSSLLYSMKLLLCFTMFYFLLLLDFGGFSLVAPGLSCPQQEPQPELELEASDDEANVEEDADEADPEPPGNLDNGNYYSIIGDILELYGDNGKENGNYYSIIGYTGDILGLYGDNGKEHGNYYMVYWGHKGIMEKNMETTIEQVFRE